MDDLARVVEEARAAREIALAQRARAQAARKTNYALTIHLRSLRLGMRQLEERMRARSQH